MKTVASAQRGRLRGRGEAEALQKDLLRSPRQWGNAHRAQREVDEAEEEGSSREADDEADQLRLSASRLFSCHCT